MIGQNRSTLETLANNHQLWTTLFDQLSTAVYLKTLDGHWLYANDASHRLWSHGPIREPQTNRPKTDPELLPLAQITDFAQADAKVIRHQARYAFTTRYSRQASTIFVRKSLVSLIEGSQLILTECQDITGYYRQSTETSLDALEDALQELQQTQLQLIQHEKMSNLGQLMVGVAHEINNPVNFIYGNIRHAQSYTERLIELVRAYRSVYNQPMDKVQATLNTMDVDFLLADLPKVLASMQLGADRIRSIVSSLRTFSRMDEATVQTVDLHDGINSTLMILGHRFKAQGQRPDIVVQKQYGDLPGIECYAGQLNQVFMNLLVNAIDALEEMIEQNVIAVPLKITISTEIKQRQAVIGIHNGGPGIPSHIQARLFEPFFTTKPIGKGTGMGLSLSHQIISERHHGQLTCESSDEQGTTFTISIPITQCVSAPNNA